MKKISSYVRSNARFLVFLAIMALSISAKAVGVVDAEIQGASDDAVATFTLVKTGAVTFLVFAIGYRFARKWLK